MSIHLLELDVILILAAFVYSLHASLELPTEPTELGSDDTGSVYSFVLYLYAKKAI